MFSNESLKQRVRKENVVKLVAFKIVETIQPVQRLPATSNVLFDFSQEFCFNVQPRQDEMGQHLHL